MLFEAPFGQLVINEINGVVTRIDFETSITHNTHHDPDITNELFAYFENAHHPLKVPVNPSGTAFQQKVWTYLQTIPCGTVITYGELAKKLESSPRAIGQACRNNPIPVIIPCHRVVSANGMGGYAGATDGKLLAMKKWLLQHENAI